jgi:allantoinase
MPDYAFAIRDAVLPGGGRADIGIAGDGTFAAIDASLPGSATDELDAGGLLALPAMVDPHVHFNEPGARSHWEGWQTGSAAAVAGGVGTVIEMPLNASPPTTNAATFQAKRACAERRSYVDFGLWGGVIPGNRCELAALATCGAAGFKAFMSTSGSDDFPACDDLTLYEAMATIAELELPLLVHAESDTITRELAARARAAGRTATIDYIRSRPAVAETEAIARAIELATVTGCTLHIVHVSTARGVELVTRARAAGLDVSCEVTPHHLLLSDDDAIALGAVSKCAPPLRPPAELAALREALDAGEIAFVASDHSPAPAELKASADAFDVWGGISCCQSTLELLLGENLPPEQVARITATAAARRFRLSGKGALRPGFDADLTLVELGRERVLTAEELRYRHRHSAFVGRTLRAQVKRTLVRGRTVYADGDVKGPPAGRLVRPANASAT